MSAKEAGYQIVPRAMAVEWWAEDVGKGERVEVLSIVEFLRRLRMGERLGAPLVYVVGLDRLLGLSRDRAATATWIRAILVDGRREVKGRAVRIVMGELSESVGGGVEVAIGEGKRPSEKRFPLQLIFGSVSMRPGGWAFATYTVS